MYSRYVHVYNAHMCRPLKSALYMYMYMHIYEKYVGKKWRLRERSLVPYIGSYSRQHLALSLAFSEGSYREISLWMLLQYRSVNLLANNFQLEFRTLKADLWAQFQVWIFAMKLLEWKLKHLAQFQVLILAMKLLEKIFDVPFAPLGQAISTRFKRPRRSTWPTNFILAFRNKCDVELKAQFQMCSSCISHFLYWCTQSVLIIYTNILDSDLGGKTVMH